MISNPNISEAHKKQIFIFYSCFMGAMGQMNSTQLMCFLILQPKPQAIIWDLLFLWWRWDQAKLCTAPDWIWQVPHIPDIPLVKVCHVAELEVDEAGMHIPPSVCADTSHGNRWEYIILLQRSKE